MVAKQRSTRVDDVYAQLRRDILDTRLLPGSQVPEPELALRMGVSRTPVREALIKLQAEGLIELIPRHGVRILPVSADDMREIYGILIALEPEVAAEAAQRQQSEQSFTALETAMAKMEAALEGGDLRAWANADDDFHRALLALGENRRMTQFISTLFDQAHRARMVTVRLRSDSKRSTQEHRKILRAITAGRPDEARALFRSHRERTAGVLLSILEETQLRSL
ncbi:MAG: GntR family transcriptional regulator [Pseudomonadota bacterium]